MAVCYPIYAGGDFPFDVWYFRYGHSLNVIPERNNALAVFGGYKGPKDLYILEHSNKLATGNSEDLTWKKTVLKGIRGRAAQATFNIGSDLYIHGGYNKRGVLSDMVKVNLETMETSILKYNKVTVNCERRWHCHFYRKEENKFFIHGGWNAGGPLNDVQIFDLNTNEWSIPTITGAGPSPRRWHSLEQFDNTQYISFGGYDGDHSKPFGDVHILDIESGKWFEAVTKGPAPEPRSKHEMIRMSDKLFLLLGGSSDVASEKAKNLVFLHKDEMRWQNIVQEGELHPVRRISHKSIRVSEHGIVMVGGGIPDYINNIYFLDTRMLKCVNK